MLAPGIDALRLSLHVLAATVWVGGQVVLAGLVPTLRRVAPEGLRPVARQFARLAWPAFAVLVGTGIWNVAANPASHEHSAWRVALWIKIGVVALSGAATLAHQRSRRPVVLAVGGALGSLGALAALVLGVLLAG